MQMESNQKSWKESRKGKKMTDNERVLHEELTFLFCYKVIQPKDYPKLEKLMVELEEKIVENWKG